MPIEISVRTVKELDVHIAKLRLNGGIKTLQKLGPNFSSDQIDKKKTKLQTLLLSDLHDIYGGDTEPTRESKVQSRIGKLIAIADIRDPAQVQRILRSFRLALEGLENEHAASRVANVTVVRNPDEQTPHTRGFELAAPTKYRNELLAKAFPNDAAAIGRIDALITAAKTELAEYAKVPTPEKLRRACILLGRAGVQGDREARGRLEQLAGQDHTAALEALRFVHAESVPADVSRALKYAQRGAALNSHSAHAWLGRYYRSGEHCSRDPGAALHHYEAAEATFDASLNASGGGVDVTYPMAELYMEPGPTQNLERSLECLHLAASRNNLRAALNLASTFYDRPQSASSTAAWARTLHAGAEEGYMDAAFLLGLAHSRRYFTDADNAVAVRYLHRAADAGNGTSAFLVAQHYESGRGVAKDTKKALQCYRFAAKHNNRDALRLLSQRYMMGIGVAQNIERGLGYLKQFADLGDPQAAMLYAQALERNPIDTSTHEAMVHYYTLAANGNIPEARAALARICG